MGIEYTPAIDMFVPKGMVFTDAKPRGALVIHKTAGIADAVRLGEFFGSSTENPDRVSSHFGIGKDGTVCQYVSLADGAGGNCCFTGEYDPYWDQFINGQNPSDVNANLFTISIEHCDDHKDVNGNYDNQGDVTEAQWKSSVALCEWLRDNYDMQPKDVKTHASIDPVNRSHCPGNFDMSGLVSLLEQPPTVVEGNEMGPLDYNKKLEGAKLTVAQELFNDTDMWESGIGQAYQVMCANDLPPGQPVTKEIKAIDDNGQPIAVRYFAMGVRIEWNYETNTARIFTIGQEVK